MEVRSRIRDAINRAADRRALGQENERHIIETHRRDALTLTVLLFAISVAALWSYPRSGIGAGSDASHADLISFGVDPNHARWSELALLPGFGETMARRVVDFREQRRRDLDDPTAVVFQEVADLRQIKGIGDRKLMRAGRFLRFTAAP